MQTSVGYIGGKSESPTYEEVCQQANDEGHTEAIRIVFDPQIISFEALMERFFFEATPNIRRVQYRSSVWTQSPLQAEIASRVSQRYPGKDAGAVLVCTDNKPFYEAEDWHQKYYEKQCTPRLCRRLL